MLEGDQENTPYPIFAQKVMSSVTSTFCVATPFLEGPPPPNPTGQEGSAADSCQVKTMVLDTQRSGSSVVTMKPFSPVVDLSTRGAKSPKVSSNNRKTLKTKPQDNRTIQIAPGLYEANDFDKYMTVVVDTTNSDIFDIHRDLVSVCGSEPKIYTQGSGRLLVEAPTPAISQKLQNLTLLGGVTATCAPHTYMNKSRGIVYAPQLLRYPEDKLLAEFASQGVSDVRRLSRLQNNAVTPLPQLVLTYDRLTLPEHLNAAWYRYKIRPFVPRPRRCFHCQEFGHILDSCRRKAQGLPSLCVNCGQESHGNCTNTPRCVHCGGDHPSSSKQCDMFRFENEVQSIRISDRLPYREARIKAQSTVVRPGLTFAKVVADSKSFKKRTTVQSPPSVPVQHPPRMKRAQSKDSLSEPPNKISIVSSPSPILGNAPAVAGPSISSEAASTAVGASAPFPNVSSPPISGDVPAVAGPSASSEAAPTAVGASTPTGATSVVCDADAHAAEDIPASSGTVAASADHSEASALSDSQEAVPVVSDPCKPLPGSESGSTPCDVLQSPMPVSGKHPTSQKHTQQTSVRQRKKPSVPSRPPSNTSSMTHSKTKPTGTQKPDKNLKRLSRDSPLAGRKPQ